MCRSLLMATLTIGLEGQDLQSVLLLSVMVVYGCALMAFPYRDTIAFAMDSAMTVVDIFTLSVPVLYEYQHARMMKLSSVITIMLIGAQVSTPPDTPLGITHTHILHPKPNCTF